MRSTSTAALRGGRTVRRGALRPGAETPAAAVTAQALPTHAKEQ